MEESGVKLIAQGSSAFDADMKSATRALDTFVDGTEKGGGRVGAAGQVMIGGLRELGTIATQAFVQAAKATAAFVGESIGLAGDFEAGMLNFQAVAGKDVDTKGLEQFRDLFLQIGKELPVSTADVQKAATEMIKGGIDPAIVAAGGLRQNIQFAAAAMEGDLVAAAEISAKVLGGWTDATATAQQKTDFLTMSTNLMTKAANASAVDVKGLSQGIFNAQGIAKVAGVSFEDLTTTLATLAPRFASTSEAGNSLKNMIARLQPTTAPAQDAMKALGLLGDEIGNKFYDATGRFVGFEQASQILQDSLVGLNEKQRASILQTIFGNDAMSAAAALADMGAKGYQNMAAKMAEANGVAENAALKQQGFNTAMDNAKGSVEALQITIGSALLPVLTDLMNNVVAPAVNTITSFAEAFMKMVPAIQASDDPLQTFLNALKVAAPQFLDVISGIESFKDTVVSIAKPIMEMASALADRLEPVVVSIGDAIQGLITDFSEGGDGANALGSAVDDLSGVWTKASDVVANVMDAYMAIATAVLPVVTRFVDEHGEEISAFFKQTWDSIIQIVTLALQVYNGIVPPILNAIAGFIDAHGSEIVKILTGAWEIVSSLITGVLDTIKGIFTTTLAIINGDWAGAWAGIKTIADAQMTAITGVITGFLNMIAGIFDTSLADILQVWENNWNMLIEIANKVGARMVEAGANIVSGIVEGIESNASAIYNVLSDIADGAVQAFLDAIGAGSPAKEFVPAGEFAVMGLMQGIEGMWPALTSLVADLGDDLVNQAADIASQVQDGIADAFGATASIDRQIASNLDKFKAIPEQYQQFTTGALQEAQNQAQAMADPAEGAKFFALRSKQILEYAKLQQDLAEAETQDDRDRITAQMILINKAQVAELSGFDANLKATSSGVEQLMADIQALLSNTDLPGILESPAVASLTSILRQLGEQGTARAQSYANPPMAASQYGWQPPQTSSSNSTYNMPIYTNNSPAALQQSLAVMQASMA